MAHFRTLVGGKSEPHLRLISSMAFPVPSRRDFKPPSLRVVAGREFTRRTGLDQVTDLTPAQQYFGALGVIDRTGPLGGIYPAFERY